MRCLVYILRFYKYHFQIFSMSKIWNGNRIFSILSQQRDMPRRDIINFETKRHCGLSTLNLKDFNSIAIRLVVHFPVIFVYLNNIVAVPAIWKSKKIEIATRNRKPCHLVVEEIRKKVVPLQSKYSRILHKNLCSF